MILDEKHQKIAIEIVQRNRKKKSCNKCYDRGYIGFTMDKTIIPCEKCVDIEAAMEEWKKYVAEDQVLKEEYKELFEEEETPEEATIEPQKTEEPVKADTTTPPPPAFTKKQAKTNKPIKQSQTKKTNTTGLVRRKQGQ